jgi:CRISPR-associated protein Csx17
VNTLDLEGVRADAILGYLKAIGLFRLVAEQADRDVRGGWDGAHFALRTNLNRDELETFLLDRYRPSPVFNPWNSGAGFDAKSRTQAAGRTLDAVANTESTRWERPRAVLALARLIASEVVKTSSDAKTMKVGILRRLRERYPDDALPWLDAAVVVGRADPDYPRLLGTGGNDGRLDFSINFLQRALDVVGPKPLCERVALLRDALDGTSTGKLAIDVAIGQYAPAGAGGINATTGFDATSLVNPWDVVLLIEGAIVFAGSMAKRFGATVARAAFPFTFASTTGGYGSASAEEHVRGEVWLPRWRGLATYRSIATMIRTSRVDVDTTIDESQPTARAAASGIEAAQAVVARGVNAGLEGFDRVVIAQRNGLAYAATRVGFISAAPNDVSGPAADLAREAERWVRKVRRAAESLGAGARSALKAYDDAIFAFTARTAGPGKRGERVALQVWVAALGALDAAVGAVIPENIDPFRFQDAAAALRIADALDDGSDEHALAAGWASVGRRPDHRMRVDLSPVAFIDNKLSYTRSPRRGATLAETLSAACVRRYRIAHDEEDRAAIDGSERSGVSLGVVARFLEGNIRIGRLEQLLLGYAVLPPVRVVPEIRDEREAGEQDEPPAAWCAMRLLSGPLQTASTASRRARMPLDPEIPQLLHAKRATDALIRTYRASQIVSDEIEVLQERPLRDIRFADLDAPQPACAALLLPLSSHARRRLIVRALYPKEFA